MYLSISHSFLDRFAWNMDQIQAISHVHTAAWLNNRSQPDITGYWPVIENFQNWKNRTDNFQKREKPDRWSGHKSVQLGLSGNGRGIPPTIPRYCRQCSLVHIVLMHMLGYMCQQLLWSHKVLLMCLVVIQSSDPSTLHSLTAVWQQQLL